MLDEVSIFIIEFCVCRNYVQEAGEIYPNVKTKNRKPQEVPQRLNCKMQLHLTVNKKKIQKHIAYKESCNTVHILVFYIT